MALVLLSLFNYGCQDDAIDGGGHREIISGLPATVNLTLKVNDMDVRTRSIVDEASGSYCANLWIGIYDSKTGKLIEKFYLTDVASTQEEDGEKYALSLKTSSAESVYIVGVANSEVNNAVDSIAGYGKSETLLRTLLDKADTFDKFKAICVLRPDAQDVNVYANTLTMSGWYAENQGDALQAIDIQEGNNNLSGAIYLKRIISYNKFVIVPGDYINLKLNTWKVCNIPAGSYLFEQSDNVGDHYSGSTAFYNASNESRLFTATTNAKGVEGYSFEFYQLENKHTAVDYAADGTNHVGIDGSASDWYTEREREFKDENGANTGIYRSLVANKESDLQNNSASYVVVNATIDYYVAAPDNYDDFDPTTAKPIDPASTGKKIHRTANVDYTIHLGYCDSQNEDGTPTIDTAKDFNCRRNTKYTYNVTINGVKHVVVEAKSEDGTENQPGAEGWVSDEYGDYEELDSHYCEFNIRLSEEERAKMSYRITAPYDGVTYYYTRRNDGTVDMTEGMHKDLYSWIKFYPTSGETVLAEYNGGKGKNDKEGDEGGSGLWTFDDMCGENRKESPYDADADGYKWYTVFVDEYVYHFDDNVVGQDPLYEDIKYYDEQSWPKYVNQDDRIAEFIMNHDISTDTESSYSYCKYAFGQKSIQTYYKGRSKGDTAIGVEHTEETYCLNMNWKFLTHSYFSGTWGTNEEHTENVYDYANGRYNLYHYLDTLNLFDSWKNVIQATVPAHVMAGERNGCSHPDADYPVYMPQKGASKTGNAPTPNDGNAYYANSICMNRNRDLNGDGRIDANEIRWFLPTSSVYIQIAVAQSELPDPIMDFTSYPKDYFKDGYVNHDYVYGTFNYHYVTSDYQYYWAEQSVTTGNELFDGWNTYATQANTARCVRNLGTNPANVPVKGKPEVGYAYTYSATDRTFTQNNFNESTLRGYNYGGIAPHDISSPSARPYKKFEYAEHICKNLSDEYISFGSNGQLGFKSAGDNYLRMLAWSNSLKKNGICSQYTQEDDESDLGSWRIPTACELALMWVEGLLRNTPAMESGYASISYGSSFYFCATQDYFVTYDDNLKNFIANYTDDYHRYLGYNDTNDRQVMAMDAINNWGSVRLRCVRDVKM
jgi:hypothetical protein